jgi:hypothetical protein
LFTNLVFTWFSEPKSQQTSVLPDVLFAPRRTSQRHKKGAATQEYSVNLYLGSPSKVPIFAHGMGALDGVTLREVAILEGKSGGDLGGPAYS